MNKYLGSPLVSNWKIYKDDLACFQFHQKFVVLNKPRYIGLTVLELSKLLMYQFHYNYFSKKFDNLKILFSDTDSFCYAIKTKEDLYKEIKDDIEWFDFSNYNKEHENFNNDNHLIPGKMKDEMGGKVITEFVGLRSKMYSVLLQNQKVKKTAKGFTRNMQKDIRHDNYLQCIDDDDNMIDFSFKGNKLEHSNHEIFLVEKTKAGLCAYNDKKYIKRIGNRQFLCKSFGHFNLRS